MHGKRDSASNKAGDAGEIEFDFFRMVRLYKDGRFKRLMELPFVPASEDPGVTGVATKDVFIDRDTGVAARLFLPSTAATTGRRLPIVVYIHGGGFVAESAFHLTYHQYGTKLAARAAALVVSVEYRLAPEHPVPAAYDDAWTALRWVASFSDPWLAGHGNPKCLFLAGDSSGANIAYHTAVRASRDGVDMEGLILVHPHFWGTKRLPSELAGKSVMKLEYLESWSVVTGGRAGTDDPRLDPPSEEIASLTCRRVLVTVAEKDLLRERGQLLAARMRDCGCAVTLFESAGVDHGFHLYRPPGASSAELLDHVAEFINKNTGSPSSTSKSVKSSL